MRIIHLNCKIETNPGFHNKITYFLSKFPFLHTYILDISRDNLCQSPVKRIQKRSAKLWIIMALTDMAAERRKYVDYSARIEAIKPGKTPK